MVFTSTPLFCFVSDSHPPLGPGHKTQTKATAWSKYPSPYNPYSAEYNARVHGPYDPAVDYSAVKKQKLWTVALKDYPEFLQSRNYNPKNMLAVASRFIHGYGARHIRPKQCGMAWFFQINFMVGLGTFLLQFKGFQSEARMRYHW